jgi:capsular polysaccharide biosynthesis protein
MMGGQCAELPPAAWDAPSLIDRSYPLRHERACVLGPAVLRHQARSFAPSTASETAYHLVFDDAVFDPQSGIVSQAGGARRWACSPVPGEEEEARARARAAVAGPRGVVFCGFHRHWRDQGHFLTECVPAIAGYETHPEWRRGTLLLPPLQADQTRLLDLARTRTGGVAVIDPDRAIACERLVVSSLMAERTAPSLLCSSVFDLMRERAGLPRPPTLPAAVYVRSSDTTGRPLRNEAEVIALMRARGIENLVVGSMSMEEQIARFQAARLVVGAHGATLANVVFCEPGAVLYELFPEHWVFPSNNILAQQNDLHYWADAFPSNETSALLGNRVPWTVDLAALECRLDELAAAHQPGLGITAASSSARPSSVTNR